LTAETELTKNHQVGGPLAEIWNWEVPSMRQ